MAFVPVTTAEIAVGEAVSNATLTKIKNNFDEFDSRLTSIEAGNNYVYQPINLSVRGKYDFFNGSIGIVKTTPNFSMTLTGVRLIIDIAGSSGTTEIDLEFKRGGGAWTSLFTTKPSVSYTAGNDATSSNQLLNPTYVDLQAGDLIRLNLTSAQTAGIGFMVRIDFVKT